MVETITYDPDTGLRTGSEARAMNKSRESLNRFIKRYTDPTYQLRIGLFGGTFFESVSIIAVAILSYVPFLLDFTPIPLTYVAVFNLALYLLISWKFYRLSLQTRLKVPEPAGP